MLKKSLFVLPNLFTLASLFCGFYAIAQSFGGRGLDGLFRAALAILFGAVFDAFDGRVARLTRTQTAMGLELDSLADVVTFGVAPAALVYNWGLARLGVVGLVASFAWLAAGALRLARFNVLAHTASGKPGRYIVGLPIPCAASVVVALVVVAHSTARVTTFDPTLETGAAWGLAVIVVAVAALMVSRVRFRSFKTVRWTSRRTIGGAAVVVLSAAAVGIGLHGAYVFLFLISLYILLGLLETLVRPGERRARDAGGRGTASQESPPRA